MPLLRRRFHPLPLMQVAAALETGERLSVDAVVVTFDGGAPVSLVCCPTGGEGASTSGWSGDPIPCGPQLYLLHRPGPASDRYALSVERRMDTGWFAAMLTMTELVSDPSTHRPSRPVAATADAG